MMEAAVSAVQIGSVIAIDEGIVGFKGRSRHKITIKNKPTPTGLKVWALAAQGYLLSWFWHQPGPRFGPVGLPSTDLRSLVNIRALNNGSSNNGSLNNGPSNNGSSDEGSDSSSDDIIYRSSSEDSDDESLEPGPGPGPLDEPSDKLAAELIRDITADRSVKLPPLNPTQTVVVALVNKLPVETYHVIVDNL